MASPCKCTDEENSRNNLSHLPVLGQNIKGGLFIFGFLFAAGFFWVPGSML
jgi:hypothetical protein